VRLLRVLAFAALAGLTACAMPLPTESLPETPLAFIHRTSAQGRDRADLLQRRRGEQAKSGKGVMKLNELENMLGRIRGISKDMKPELQGRLALYHPRTQRVELIDAFIPGALPCDWSQDRTRLLVASGQRGVPRLFDYSVPRKEVAQAVAGPPGAVQISGAYAPSGRVAYADVRRTQAGVETMLWMTGGGGAVARQLTKGPRDNAVRWSPDGKVILFEGVLSNGAPVIKALDVLEEHSEPRVIARGREARFSPRGDWVVYSRERGPGWRLWRMRPDGTGKTALGHAVQGLADERHPTISPDGQYVAYMAEANDRQQIRIRAMDGSGDRLLIEDADGTMPVW